jgi:undecaprenyl diphosphate synthase
VFFLSDSAAAETRPWPRHVAIIMDGNGRWARQRRLPRIEGHKEGIKSVRSAVEACRSLEIPFLTLYTFSVENWQRPKAEVAELMKLLHFYLNEEVPRLHRDAVRLMARVFWLICRAR